MCVLNRAGEVSQKMLAKLKSSYRPQGNAVAETESYLTSLILVSYNKH